MNRKENGFTLIELVTVITILGILAAFAFPRFTALGIEARASTVNALAGSLRSASMLVHSLWLVQGSPGTVDMEGNTITMVNGYPNLATIDDTLVDLSGFTFDPGTGIFTKDGATSPANCSVDYNEAAAGNPPVIVVDDINC